MKQIKAVAPESSKTQKAREKLARQWEGEKGLITQEALASTSDKIRKWIADNAKHRVAVKSKLELFNQNKDAAALSRKVQLLAEKLKTLGTFS